MKSGVVRGADAELFVVGAELDGEPRLFLVESKADGMTIESDPSMGVRAASLSRLVLKDVAVEKIALLGDAEDYRECVRLSRLAWCALAVGTAQAVLDYVTPYVKEREAFGEPIAHRQSVAFMVANIAIELQGMRLVTYRAAEPGGPGQAGRARDRPGPSALCRARHADRPRRRPAARWPRLRQGAPRGAVVPRPASHRPDGRSGPGLSERSERIAMQRTWRVMRARSKEYTMINLETPKKIRPLIDQAHQVAMNMLRPISRKYDEAEHEYPKELDMLAAMIDGISESGASGGAGAAGVRRSEKPEEKKGNKNGANLASVLSIMEMCWGDVGLLLSMPRQGLGNSAIASVANDEQLEKFAGTWAAMAITEPGHRVGLRQHPDDRHQGRRRVRPQRREDLRHLR